jgi:glutamate dehydrogenase (NADP+)
LPCAVQNELNEEDAEKLISNGCKLVAEGANMPTTPEAIAVLQKNGILYAPGKATNAGGVAVSGLEMSQNSARLYWTREEVENRLKGIMQKIHDQCRQYGKDADDNIDYLKGANIAGFVRVADAMLAEGHV